MKQWHLVGLCACLFLSGPSMVSAQTAGDLMAALQSNSSVVSLCPALVGAKIGSVSDRATWSASFASGASIPCQSAVNNVIANFVLPPTSVQITSTLFPALDGTYPIDAASLQNMQFLSSYVAINGAFPAAQPTQIWLDTSQQRHTFTTTAEWQAFAKAVADFYALVQLGQTPSQPVAIP